MLGIDDCLDEKPYNGAEDCCGQCDFQQGLDKVPGQAENDDHVCLGDHDALLPNPNDCDDCGKQNVESNRCGDCDVALGELELLDYGVVAGPCENLRDCYEYGDDYDREFW